MPLMSAFLLYPKEAAIIGRLLAGYGELEFVFANCLAVTASPKQAALRGYFAIRGEAIRLDIAKNFAHDAFGQVGLANKFLSAYSDMKFCHKARNTYAHCHWQAHTSGGLFYVNLETTAAKGGKFSFNHQYFHVDVKQLETVEDFFWSTLRRSQYLIEEFRAKTGMGLGHHHEWPAGKARPNLHNPPETHPSPWFVDPQTHEEEAPWGDDPPQG
jgi:hypothetical protein